MVRDAAAGKRFLNLFAYTGSFTVYAAAGGAEVDHDRRSVEHLSRLGPAQHAAQRFAGHRAPASSATTRMELPACSPPRAAFDLAVVDPPTFSNSKRIEDFWDIQRDHVELLNRLVERMTPGGLVFFSTNFRRFKLAEAAAPRRDDPRDQPTDGPARLPQRADPSDVENHPSCLRRQASTARGKRGQVHFRGLFG